MTDTRDVLEALREHILEESRPFASAPELAERLPVGRSRVRDLLELLEAAGRVESHRVGSGRAWWPSNLLNHAGVPPAGPASDTRQRDRLARPASGGTSEDPPEATPEPLPEANLEDALQAAREAMPGSGDTLDLREDAVRACLELLQERGSTRKATLVDEIYPQHPAGYGSEGGWWNTVGKKGLQAAAERLEHLHAPGEGEPTWTLS